MPTIIRRKPTTAAPEEGTKPVARRRVTVPIKAVDTAKEAENREQVAKAQTKAYVPPAGEERETSGTDYAAVIARYEAKVKNPKSAIRARCVQCCNGQLKEIQLCQTETCALHPFRMGINPFNKRTAARLAAESGAEGSEDDEDDDE